jgi:1,4-alpha-glucan branching enzyme
MSASQEHIDTNTPLGATLVNGGATFRVWAPTAREIYVRVANGSATLARDPNTSLVRSGDYWAGFLPGVHDGDRYRFYVVGAGGEGFKRDPYARELELDGYPNCECIVREPGAFAWRDAGFRTPAFSDLSIYQFHFGVYYAKDAAGRDIRRGRVGKFLDVVDRIEYLADLGVNAVMPLPVQEFQTENSLGYNGTDLFSPEMDYSVPPDALAPYLERVNRLYRQRGQQERTLAELTGQVNQLKVFIDLCHLYGLAVIADVVYNHAGGPFDDQSLYFFDREPAGDNADSQYFLREGLAGGLVFAFWKQEVHGLLIDNAKSLLGEYHVDGLRFDEVTVIDRFGGWSFAQDLTSTLRFVKPEAVLIAEYWNDQRWMGVATPPFGMGFHVGYSDTLRGAIRNALEQASHGTGARVDFDRIKAALELTYREGARWTVFQCVENHDLLDDNHGDKQPRIARLADPNDPRSWYARSRARVAMGLLLTAPGIPMLFMGQEFLEDKYWSDWPGKPELLLYWAGLEGQDKAMSDFHRCTRELLWLRRRQPALRGEGLNVFHVHDDNRVIAFHRWVPGAGRDVLVIANLGESTHYAQSYRLGLPGGGHWTEVFNSDVFDTFVNPNVQGNPGGIDAEATPWDGMPYSAGFTLPASSVLVFARDFGD